MRSMSKREIRLLILGWVIACFVDLIDPPVNLLVGTFVYFLTVIVSTLILEGLIKIAKTIQNKLYK